MRRGHCHACTDAETAVNKGLLERKALKKLGEGDMGVRCSFLPLLRYTSAGGLREAPRRELERAAHSSP